MVFSNYNVKSSWRQLLIADKRWWNLSGGIDWFSAKFEFNILMLSWFSLTCGQSTDKTENFSRVELCLSSFGLQPTSWAGSSLAKLSLIIITIAEFRAKLQLKLLINNCDKFFNVMKCCNSFWVEFSSASFSLQPLFWAGSNCS